MFYLSICFVRFIFLFLVGVSLFVAGFYFVLKDLIYFIEWDIITLNSARVVINFLSDWISLVFTGFVFLISSLVYIEMILCTVI
jgi:NADH-ubiquinone oxidoreductase chain 5